MFSLDWRLTAVCLLVFVLIVAVTRYVSLGSLVVSAIFLCLEYLFRAIWGLTGLAPEARPQFYAVSAVIAAMGFLEAQGKYRQAGTGQGEQGRR